MIAEIQVESLSKIIENHNAPKLPAKPLKYGGRNIERPLPSKPNKIEPDMQIVTVTADKVHLRTGPGKENSPLMAVTKGMRLAVETRNGDWFRVMTPNGARAWISSDVVAFGVPEPTNSSRLILPDSMPNMDANPDGSELNDNF